MPRFALVIASVIAAAGVAAAASTATPSASRSTERRATLRTFAGSWWGHTRGLVITRRGRARESIGDGCCHPVIDLTLQLSHPSGTVGNAAARATVVGVSVHDKHAFTKAHPAPHVGQTGRVRLRNDVITESLTGTNYCGSRAGKKGICGA